MEFSICSWTGLDESLATSGALLDETVREEVSELRRFLEIHQDFPLPLRISKGERPDFRIGVEQEGRIIGLEHTWAANQAWEQAEQHLGSSNEIIARNWLEGVERKGKSLGRYISGRQKDSCTWSAREHAQAKAGEVAHAVERKLCSLNSAGFQQYPDNWLLISDRMPFLFLDLDCFGEAGVCSTASEQLSFTRVFFLTRLADRDRGGEIDALFEIPLSTPIRYGCSSR